jgi:hypothetical protein
MQMAKSVFDELEFISRCGATTMKDRSTVLHLGREWDFTETADWIEIFLTDIYGRLTIQGPDVIEDNRADQQIEEDLDNPNIEITPFRPSRCEHRDRRDSHLR